MASLLLLWSFFKPFFLHWYSSALASLKAFPIIAECGLLNYLLLHVVVDHRMGSDRMAGSKRHLDSRLVTPRSEHGQWPAASGSHCARTHWLSEERWVLDWTHPWRDSHHVLHAIYIIKSITASIFSKYLIASFDIGFWYVLIYHDQIYKLLRK